MKIPVTITIMIEIPDSVVKQFNQPTNQPPTQSHQPAIETTAIVPAHVKEVPKKKKFRRGTSVAETERFGGISITPLIAQVLKYVMEQGKTIGSTEKGMSYSSFTRAVDAGLLTSKKVIVKNSAGNDILRAEYELTDLGLDALAWYERTYE